MKKIFLLFLLLQGGCFKKETVMDQVIDDLNRGSYDVSCVYESSDLVNVCDQQFYEDDHEGVSDEAIYDIVMSYRQEARQMITSADYEQIDQVSVNDDIIMTIHYDNEDEESFDLYYYKENILRILIDHEFEVYYRFDASLLERLEMIIKIFENELRKAG